MKLTPHQKRALELLKDGDVCRRNWSRLVVNGHTVPATTMWWLTDHGLIDYAYIGGKDEFRITPAGQQALEE